MTLPRLSHFFSHTHRASNIQAVPLNAKKAHLVLARSDLQFHGNTAVPRSGVQHMVIARDASQAVEDILIQRGFSWDSLSLSKLWNHLRSGPTKAKLAAKEKELMDLEGKLAKNKQEQTDVHNNENLTFTFEKGKMDSYLGEPIGQTNGWLQDLERKEAQIEVQKDALKAKIAKLKQRVKN